MASRNQMPELNCLDPENYRKYFRKLCWSVTRKYDKKPLKKVSKKERIRRMKAANILAISHAPSLLGNPSQFAVYSTVRRTILSRWKHLQASLSEYSDDSDNEDGASPMPIIKLPKITGIGLRTVFTLILEASTSNAQFCEHALTALLDVLQGHAPEELSQEPSEMIANLHAMLVEVASGSASSDRLVTSTTVTAVSSSCLIALSVARGEAELILNAVSLLIMSPPELSEQNIVIPLNLTKLQRSVQSVILGASVRNQWHQFGVPHQCLITSFPVDLPASLTTGPGELVVRSLVCDGCFLYIFTSKGLLKIGSGYGSSIKQHIYLYKPDFFASERHGWMGHCKNKLYLRVGRKKTEIYEINKDTLEVENAIKLDPGPITPVEPKSAVFTDGNQLGLILLTNFDTLTIRMYNVDVAADRVENETSVTLISHNEIKVHLLRRKTLAIGRASFEDFGARRFSDFDAPIVTQLDDDDEDPLISIYAGQEFALLTTASGKVYYTGKGNSLGYKTATANTLRWTLMKDTILTKNDGPNVKIGKIVQIAIGHEGVHAIMVLDNGTALFTGVARRGEDGDASKHKRNPKPSRPKKMLKADGHHVVYAACNYGSTALITRQGLLLMFGKDTQHCDPTGLVHGLRHERVIQVALGKAHAVVLTNSGLVYTFGINNKGQCGREFGYTKEKLNMPRPSTSNKEDAQLCQTPHTWSMDYCRVCVLCRECTGFSNACHCSQLPNRVPREKCGCGEGDSGCTECGICRVCAETFTAAGGYDQTVMDLEEELGEQSSDNKIDKEAEQSRPKEAEFEAQPSTSEMHGDVNSKVNCLAPARVALPGGHRVVAIASGLHHTVLLTEHGDVLTFGSNQYGQLGAGDLSNHHRIVRVRVAKASSIAAGSNHTAVLSVEGELYTFGNYQKGSLGRPRKEEPPHGDRRPVWHATPARVPRLGPRFSCKAVWVSASGDQTFVQVSQALIKTDTLFSSTITSNNKCIIILPNHPEHTFKCLTITKADGSCNTWTGPEQVDFINALACLDPLYDVLWCYQPQMKVMKCYNILAFDSHKLQRCCNSDPNESSQGNYNEYPNYGNMKRLEDFKNMEHFEVMCNNQEKPTHSVALLNLSVLNQQLAIPSALGCVVTRMHAALHLLGCLDSLTYAHDNKIYQVECIRDNIVSTVTPVKDDFLTVNRFEGHGGGWGYSGHSVEAIRFMCDTDILLGGYGLFGGRGDYTSKIKLFDIGLEGGEQEGNGDLVAESDEIVFECAPRDRFPVLFKSPIPVLASRWYVAWACINGPSSDCGSSGQTMVVNDDAGFHFKTSKKSNNGTDVNAGQIPCLLYNIAGPDHVTPRKIIDYGEPIIVLSKTISRKITVACFKSLITLLKWSWNTFKTTIMDTNGQVPISYQKLAAMKHQKRLVYVIKACLRLIKSYVNEIYPQHALKRNSQEYMSYFEVIADVRNLIQTIMADPTPHCSMLSKKASKSRSMRNCFVTFAVEMTTSILNEAHETTTACFHAFFPTPTLKWNHLCSLLYYVSEGVVPAKHICELTAICAAMCSARSLRDVLQYVAPLTQTCIVNDNKRPDSRTLKEGAVKLRRSGYSLKHPPVPPRSNKEGQKSSDSSESKPVHVDWHLLDVIPKLLDVILIPITGQMMMRHCGQHDHGEIKQQEQISQFCCKLIARIVAELLHNASNIRGDLDTTTVKHIITPSRFMRVNQTRSWNTGNGSPDSICFTVDRPGVMLVGVCVYGGTGNYEYSLELLSDVKIRPHEEVNPAHCWVSLEVAHGAFNGSECHHDMVQLKFERAVPLKPDLRYAIRLCNHGARTANGDCGLPSVKGQDGTTFRFASCALSFNGTTLARGQIPSLVYYGTSRTTFNPMESTDSIVSALRTMMLRVATLVMDRSAELFTTLRNELTAEDFNRNSAVLQQSPAMNILIPYILASLERLDDSKSSIKILEMVRKFLPQVAAMNRLVPNNADFTATTGNYYTWVESDHPYKQATVTNMRVLFPPEVTWIVLEMDPRSMTAQCEDTLTVYAVAGTPKQRCHCSSDIRLADPPFRKRLIQLTDEGETEELGEENDTETPCMHYNNTYISATPKLSLSNSDWPAKGLLVPGNEVVFSLETATDYLTEYKDNENDETRFGFRCLCVGYDDVLQSNQTEGLINLEMELTYIGSACAARLLAPNLNIPTFTFNTVTEGQGSSASGNAAASTEPEYVQEDPGTSMLLSGGLEITTPPTIHHVLDGQPLLRSVTTERQFLTDFIAGAESTAGGRLARWLAPTPRVEPAKCELKAPNAPVRPSVRLTMPVILRDQYGDIVTSPALKIEVIVQRVHEVNPRSSSGSTSADARNNFPHVTYEPTIKEYMRFQAITIMKDYQDYSFEEIRHGSGNWSEIRIGSTSFITSGRVPAERLVVRSLTDGSYTASWVPRSPGLYVFRCTFDDLPSSQELTIEVIENIYEGASDRAVQAGGAMESLMPSKLRRFTARYSAGLRVRASPSLQSEELGRVPPGADVSYVEEVANKDGTWVRLCEESAGSYAEGCAGVAWCLQHNRHIDRELLELVEPSSPQLDAAGPSGLSEAPGETHSWAQEEDDDDDDLDDDRRFPFSMQCDLSDDNDMDGSPSPFKFGSEPSKRARSIRNKLGLLTSKRAQRRGNGDVNDWWLPRKHRSNENIRDVEDIIEIDLDQDPDSDSEFRSVSQLAQMGTQTSPDSNSDECVSPKHLYLDASKDDGSSASGEAKQSEPSPSTSRICKNASPTTSTVMRITPPTPKKHAISPSQAECVRSVFAATLWHEGVVHDAIACAAFLKFHPQLPKQGTRVVTRPPHDVIVARQQRHSVEVFSAGHYLRIHPSTLAALTRSGEEASTSRSRRSDLDVTIREEDGHASCSRQSSLPSIVNVLPPALRALVALWDALYDSDQLSVATDKFKKEIGEIPDNDNSSQPHSSSQEINDGNNSSVYKTSQSVKCELCNTNVPPPLAAHMRNAHPGCRASTLFGYDRTGEYKESDTPPPVADSPIALCGQLAQASQLWYVFCEKCREKTIKESATAKQLNPKNERDLPYERIELPPGVDHHVIKENAMFLLDLAPITNSESVNVTPCQDTASCSPPTPPASVWLPAPPFQSLQALKTTPKSNDETEAARYHSLGRPPMPSIAPLMTAFGIPNPSVGSQWPKVQRSMSMGQAGDRDLAHSAQPQLDWNERADNTDTLSGAGSSLLAQPSAALQRLVGCGAWTATGCAVSAFETPEFDTENLIGGPVMMFVLAKTNLNEYRQKMDVTVRINTVRQYAFEALTWFLRSTTVPTAVHDVMWWFCNAMEKFSRSLQPFVLLDENKENRVNEIGPRIFIHPPSTSVICPGGRAARGARSAFHAFLGSVSALASSLPPSSAAGLQAVRCWSLNYSAYDRAFLHRSQVFSVISKILSHSEDSVYEDGIVGAPQESYNYVVQDPFVWACPDVTSWCDITVSSRQGMAGALTDGSTETFWESGDEDRNKAKWIQISFPGGNHEDRPYIVCVHIDNIRDPMNKTLLVSFLYSGGSSDMVHMQDIEVDTKLASWICFTLPKVTCSSLRVRCELRGPEPAVRVRQIRVLSPPAIQRSNTTSPMQVLHSLSETDTLKVFRLLTSQVFGKLLEWEYSNSESGPENIAAPAVEDVPVTEDNDLREHVVGILFAGHKLTSLQSQVMSHIVSAIGSEAARVRDDWETALLCAEAMDKEHVELHAKLTTHQQDNYCFEMLSLLLALSGSAAGRAHLAQRTELLSDLLCLLHTGSERVQRQIISLLRRMITELSPTKMFAAINHGNDLDTRVTLLDHLVCYLGKAITVQMKVKGSTATFPASLTLGNSVTPAPPAKWFMRGETTKKHANIVAKLLTDMAEDKISPEWGQETRKALVAYVIAVAHISEGDRRPPCCIAVPTVWMALGALCICEQSHDELVSGTGDGREARGRDSANARPYCVNHDDGSTVAMIECRTCGVLCTECDRFLHLNRNTRTHHRQICKEEESTIRIDIHEGCGRAKLFWLLLLVDRRTLKALAEFRGMDRVCDASAGEGTSRMSGPPGLAGVCRFCGTRDNTGLLAIGNVCAEQQCQDHSRDACNRLLGCGHVCGGVRGERMCLPCLFGCSAGASDDATPLRQDADDMCMICFTDPLQAAPAIQLKCGHVFHLHCCKKILTNKWNGPRITFSFSQCPICKEDINHWTLDELLAPVRRLFDEVKRKALMRLEFEGLATPGSSKSRALQDPSTYAMERYAYYVCHKCGKAYFGGLARCEAEMSGSWDPAELICGACSDVAGAKICPKHGVDFLEYKCRYCCSVAVFFCFGTSHFCNACHDDFQRITNMPRHLLPQCPAGPKGEQLPGTSEECPLHVQHPPTGEEFALGCGVCRNAHSF